MEKPAMLYFGPWDSPGHYLVDEHGCGMGVWRKEQPKSFPWTEGQIDGSMQPHFANCRKKRPYSQSSYCDCGSGPEGVACIHRKNGWTALCFWDRSVDHRGACNSNYFAEGDFTFDEMVVMAKERFSYRWNKMNFEVKEEEKDATNQN